MPNTCSNCGGIGWVEDEVCQDCMGTGATPVKDPVRSTLKEHSDKLDALQADLDIIKPQIQAIYDDLNP